MDDELRTSMVRLPVELQTESAYLIVVAVPDGADEAPGQVFSLRGYSKLGRLMTNTIVLSDPSVSREHCAFELRHDGYYVIDEGSANGTVVSGKKVRDGQLQRQENLQIGGYRVLFWQGELDDPALTEYLEAVGVRRLRKSPQPQ